MGRVNGDDDGIGMRETIRTVLLRGSVTERLGARLDDAEAMVQRLLANEAKLIADSLAAERNLQTLADALSGAIREYRREDHLLRDRLDTAQQCFPAWFCGLSLWQRLRWLAVGR